MTAAMDELNTSMAVLAASSVTRYAAHAPARVVTAFHSRLAPSVDRLKPCAICAMDVTMFAALVISGVSVGSSFCPMATCNSSTAA